MVLLDQPSFWCPHWASHFVLLQGSNNAKTETGSLGATKTNGPSWDSGIYPRYRLSSIVSTMGRDQIQLGQCPNHCSIRSFRDIWLRVVHYTSLATRRGHSTASPPQESECPRGRDSRYIPRWLVLCLWILREFREQSF
jgi:hypothetical protein